MLVRMAPSTRPRLSPSLPHLTRVSTSQAGRPWTVRADDGATMLDRRTQVVSRSDVCHVAPLKL